jgi:excisionase family DNA binding protein
MLFSVRDLEERTGISRYTWRAWLREGRLPYVKLGRRVAVQERDLEVFLEANRVAPRHSPPGTRHPDHGDGSEKRPAGGRRP